MDIKTINLFMDIIRDLENTRDIIHGYSYRRTIRNILIGKENAIIAPYFKQKYYYGKMDYISLTDIEKILSIMAKNKILVCERTERGNLYYTHDYYNEMIKK